MALLAQCRTTIVSLPPQSDRLSKEKNSSNDTSLLQAVQHPSLSHSPLYIKHPRALHLSEEDEMAGHGKTRRGNKQSIEEYYSPGMCWQVLG